MRLTFIAIMLLSTITLLKGQTQLQANGPGNTYELINSVFAPNGGDVVETPDCAHPEFGRHIRESWDNDLAKHVFEFHIHVTPDNDRCIKFDRQRLEIKTYDASPDHLKTIRGETVEYKWKFKLPTGFKVSSSFTHLHQVKPVGGDEATPTFALTARKGNPNKLELSYYQTTALGLTQLASANLSLFDGQWVEVTERMKVDVANGTYFIEIKNIATGATILSYQNNNISTMRADNRYVRPKWGVYRSLNSPQDLRDEIVLFADFSVQELNTTSVEPNIVDARDVKILPNPATENTQLKIVTNNQGQSNIRITNLNGQLLFSDNRYLNIGSNLFQLDLSRYTTGTYLIWVDFEDESISRKFSLIK